MIRYFLLSFSLLCLFVVAVAGLRDNNVFGIRQRSSKPPIEIFPDMDRQPRFDAQHESMFYADGRSQRESIPGTVPMGYAAPGSYSTGANNNKLATHSGSFSGAPDYYNTGKMTGGVYGDGFPIEVNAGVLERGRERFTINCAVCHGATAMGNGIVGQYGLTAIANLQQERIRTMPDGQIFNTITNGKNTMGSYGAQITVEDRWAIISYLRALQRSQNATLADIPADQRAALDKPQEAAKPQ